MNEANKTQTVNAPLCEARRCSAQAAMAQTKQEEAHTEADEANDKTVRRVSWHVGVAIQHRINTRKQVAHAPCSQLDLSLVQHVLHSVLTTNMHYESCSL